MSGIEAMPQTSGLLHCCLHFLTYCYSVSNIENIKCAVSTDNEYKAVLAMTQGSRYMCSGLLYKHSAELMHLA